MSVEKRIDKKSGKISYLTRVFVGRDANGKPKYTSKSFPKKALAVEHDNSYAQFKNNTLSNIAISDKTLVSVVWLEYIKYLSEKMKDNTIISYKSRYTTWIEPELGLFPIGNINLGTIERFKHLIEDKGCSPGLTQYCLIVLKSFLEFASSGFQRYIIESPMKNYEISRINATAEKVKYLKRDQAQAFFDNTKDTTFQQLLIFLVNTGLRISEAAALRPSDFDFEAGIVTVNHNLSLYSPKRNEPILEASARVLSSPKTHERRSIALSPMAIKAAKAAMANGHYFVFTSDSVKRKIIIKRGLKPETIETSCLLVGSVYVHIKRIAKRAQVPNVGPHGMRHTFAANFLMNNGSIHALSRTLGHASMSSTEIYAHLSPEFLGATTSIVNFGESHDM